ncbi:uncharacterized protein DS421_17g593140 [Arachis hypogaea]|nr:uncharacterized protein DS421_17g593140 [Arachis hypogaea]
MDDANACLARNGNDAYAWTTQRRALSRTQMMRTRDKKNSQMTRTRDPRERVTDATYKNQQKAPPAISGPFFGPNPCQKHRI